MNIESSFGQRCSLESCWSCLNMVWTHRQNEICCLPASKARHEESPWIPLTADLHRANASQSAFVKWAQHTAWSSLLQTRGKDELWDLGTRAGFYVDGWKTIYRMYPYIMNKLPSLINANFPVDHGKLAIFGHSVGGHGALTGALKNPEKCKSMSGLAPICNQFSGFGEVGGHRSLNGYLASDQNKWKACGVAVLSKFYSGSGLDVIQKMMAQHVSNQRLPDINCF